MEPNSSAESKSVALQTDAQTVPPGHRSDLKISAVHEDGQPRYELSKEKIPSGWTTIEFDNQSRSAHFAFLRKASQTFLRGLKNDGGEISAEAYIAAAVHPFQRVFNPYYEGNIDFNAFLKDLGQEFPKWFFAHRPNGGPGLTSGGEISRTTLNLKPGTYFIECYVIGEDGAFHMNGMVEKLVVTEASSGAREPRSTMEISISDDGFEVENDQGPPGVRPGQHTVAVTFEETERTSSQGNDLHLFRFDDGTTVDELNAWMGLYDVGPDGFYNTDKFGPALTSSEDAPGPQTWLGGVQDIRDPLPETAYFHVRLKPGIYAWVAELPDPKSQGLLKTFTVPSGQTSSQPTQ